MTAGSSVMPITIGRPSISGQAALLIGIPVLLWLWPALAAVAGNAMSTDQGAHGLMILVTGVWTLWFDYRRSRDLAKPGPLAAPLLLLGAASILLAGGRIVNANAAILLGAWLGVVAILWARTGWPLVMRLWFSLLYLLFVIPVPYMLIGPMTQALKLLVSRASIDILALAKLDVAVDGNAMFVDQYELAVDAACAGLNSMASLTAVGLFYAYWRRRAGWVHIVVLGAASLPIAIAANLARVIFLVLVVHWGGIRMLTTMVHPLAGIVSFVAALGMLLIVDAAMARARIGSRQ